MTSLWVVFTLFGAAGQVARNTMQRGLTPQLGALGAALVRFLFGFPFALVFLAEYSMMFMVSMVAVILFLGAWNTPLPNMGPIQLATWTTGTGWGIIWIMLKTLALVGVQMWIRWTLPRFRVDQLMNLCWKVLTPLAFACMLISGIWRVWLM